MPRVFHQANPSDTFAEGPFILVWPKSIQDLQSNKSTLSETDSFFDDIPLSTPGLHTAWRPHVKKSQLGAPPAEFPMVQKPTSNNFGDIQNAPPDSPT